MKPSETEANIYGNCNLFIHRSQTQIFGWFDSVVNVSHDVRLNPPTRGNKIIRPAKAFIGGYNIPLKQEKARNPFKIQTGHPTLHKKWGCQRHE